MEVARARGAGLVWELDAGSRCGTGDSRFEEDRGLKVEWLAWIVGAPDTPRLEDDTDRQIKMLTRGYDIWKNKAMNVFRHAEAVIM